MNGILAYWWLGNNFGDVLTPYLIEKLSGKRAIWTDKEPDYLVTGSILGECLENVTVWGTGVIAPEQRVGQARKFCAVRGPLTRDVIVHNGGSCPEIYGDPALLLPKIYKPTKWFKQQYKIGIVPHYNDIKLAHQMFDGQADVRIIHVTDQIERVIDEMTSCKKILSSSLHGLIVSDAYEIPNIWVEFSDLVAGNGFKFRDYMASIGADAPTPINLREPKDIKAVAKDAVVHRIKKTITDALLAACPFR